MWPSDAASLVALQWELSEAGSQPWAPGPRPRTLVAGGCWVCFPRGLTGPGAEGDPAWCAAVVVAGRDVLAQRVTLGEAGATYVPGLLALRAGPLMEQAVRALPTLPEVLLVDATGRDHPRGAGLAIHLGAQLGLPTVGVTHRPLMAAGEWPADRRGATSPLTLDGVTVASWMRTRAGVRPLVVHPGWRTDLAAALEVVARTTARHRTPEPLRRARRLARRARSA